MIANPIQASAAPIVAAALGRNIGVKVEFGSYPTAFTDRQTIFLPRLPVQLPAAVETILWGFIHHEAGHIRHTDFEVLADPDVQSDALVSNLFRVFEDIRMERAHIGLYPGAGRVLSELVSELVRQSFFTPAEDDDEAIAFVDFCLKHLRVSILGQTALTDQSAHSRALLENALGTGFVTRLSAAVTRGVLDSTCTHDVLDLAIRVRQFLKDECEAREQASQTGNTEANASGGDQPDSSCGSSTGGPGDRQSPSGQPGDDEDSVPSTEGDASQSQPSSSCPTSSPEPSDEDTSASEASDENTSSPTSAGAGGDSDQAVDALRAILSGAGGDASLGDLGEALGALLGDQVESQPGPVYSLPKEERSSVGYRDQGAVSAALAVSTRLAVQLRRRLESLNSVPDAPKPRGRRVSRRHLSRVAFGDYRVFRSEVIGPEINTAVAILVDASGSMDGANIKLACRSALCAALALETIPRLSCTVAAFPGRQGNDFVEVLKGFDENSKVVSSRFGIPARGGTPLTEGLIWAGHRLGMRPEERRVIYVATDGAPNDADSALQIISSLHRAGIEVHGLGIETDDPLGLFDSFSRVTEVSRLPEAFIALSDRVLKRTA